MTKILIRGGFDGGGLVEALEKSLHCPEQFIRDISVKLSQSLKSYIYTNNIARLEIHSFKRRTTSSTTM